MNEHRARKRELKESEREDKQERKCMHTRVRDKMANLAGTVIDALSVFLFNFHTIYVNH